VLVVNKCKYDAGLTIVMHLSCYAGTLFDTWHFF